MLLLVFPLLIGMTLGGGEDDMGKCIPDLADRCFSDLTNDLFPLLKSPGEDLIQAGSEVCSWTQEALSCAKEIIDNDCTLEEGLQTFDAWMNALTAVHNYLCHISQQSLMELLGELTAEEKVCWDLFEFLDCVEQKASVTHVLDMLHVMLDQNECNWLLITFATCNVKATKTAHCLPSQDVVNELVHIFMTETICGSYCSSALATRQNLALLASTALLTLR